VGRLAGGDAGQYGRKPVIAGLEAIRRALLDGSDFGVAQLLDQRIGIRGDVRRNR
jgi:hypothetical protein